MELVYNILRKIFTLLVIIYLCLSAYYYLTYPVGIGDEGLFINDLNFIKERGWAEAIQKNISIPYMLLVYPLSLFVENFVALRLGNVILLIAFLVYLLTTKRSRNTLLVPYFLFYFGAAAYFFFGSNDTLFSISLSVFFIEAYRSGSGEKSNLPLALSGLFVAVFTRELILVYLPVIFFGLFLLVRKKEIKFTTILMPLVLFLLLFSLNFPSLMVNGSLSYDKKDPPRAVEATWTQRQYYAQLLVNDGKLNFHSHPTWKETEDYLLKNGRDSLPNSVVSGLTHNIPLTIKEFLKDFFYILIYHMRTVGFMLISILIMAGIYLKQGKSWDIKYFTSLTAIAVMAIFGLIIISYIELRWLAPIFILAIFSFSDAEGRKELPKILILFNLVFITALTCYGSFGLISKIFN